MPIIGKLKMERYLEDCVQAIHAGEAIILYKVLRLLLIAIFVGYAFNFVLQR